jgi:hypothetical protein
MSKRKLAAGIVALLVALNGVLALAQSGSGMPYALMAKLLGPNMLRAEVVWKGGGVTHDYLLDSGRIRSLTAGSSMITLVERDGKLVTVTVAPTARITLGGEVVPFSSLRRGQRVLIMRDGSSPAELVQATRK